MCAVKKRLWSAFNKFKYVTIGYYDKVSINIQWKNKKVYLTAGGKN